MTAANEKGKPFDGKDPLLVAFVEKEKILDSTERAEIYDQLRKTNRLNHKGDKNDYKSDRR